MFSVPNINIKRACTRGGEISKSNILTIFLSQIILPADCSLQTLVTQFNRDYRLQNDDSGHTFQR